MRRLRFVGIASVVACSMACAAIWGFEDLKPGGPDGGGDAPLDSNGDSGPTCPLAKPPDPPGAGDMSGIDFMTAISWIDVGIHKADAGAMPFTGFYDLDNTCTYCTNAIDSCKRSKNAIKVGPSDPTCDKDGGVDNVGTDLIQQLDNYVMNDNLSSEAANNWLNAGRYTMLVVVRGWNGKPNDPLVFVDLVPSFGLGATQTDGGPITMFQKPTWTKADKWTFWPLLAQNVNGLPVGFAPNAGDSNAYVRDGVLVAHFPNSYFVIQYQILTDNPLIVHTTETILTAKIVTADAGDYSLDEGRFQGKWATADVLREIGVWSKDDGLVNLCPGDGFYGTIRDALCSRRDIRLGKQDPMLPCDGVSVGFAFRTSPASLGGASSYAFQTSKCFNGTYDPAPKSYPDDCDFNN